MSLLKKRTPYLAVLILPLVLVAILSAADGRAQEAMQPAPQQVLVPEPAPATIDSPGHATMESPADHVEFLFDLRAKGPTAAEAMRGVVGFKQTLTSEIDARQLSPMLLEVFGPTVPDVAKPEVHAAARVRFSAAPFRESDTGPVAFASLCDALRTIAGRLNCVLTGPVMGVNEKGAVEQMAVAKAIENAYTPAEGAAAIMRSQVISVERVTIDGISWTAPLEPGLPSPGPSKALCTADVTVTYAFLAMP
ncbi:MAG: hypothetical protein GY851_31055 [bacterium]|nr:hypothetical protein [bacterium]